MKNSILFCLLLFTASAVKSQEKVDLLDSPFMYSTGSRIEVKPSGDTVLVFEQVSSIETRQDLSSQNRLAATAQNKFVAKGGDIRWEYKGTPYFKNQWHYGEITSDDGNSSKGILAYDIVYNQVFFTPNSETYAFPVDAKSFVIGDKLFYRLEEQEDGETNPFYYSKLVDGNYQLLQREYGKFIKSEFFAYNNTQQELLGKYDSETFHYLFTQGELIKISNKASFFRKLGAYGMQARKIVKEEKLDLDKVDDMRRFTEILNSIFSS